MSDLGGLDNINSPPRVNYTYSVQAGILAGIDMVSEKNQHHIVTMVQSRGLDCSTSVSAKHEFLKYLIF